MNPSRSTPKTLAASEREEDFLQRDQEPGHNLHEPQSLVSTIDPTSGKNVGNVEGKPSLVDGNLTMYFESDQTRRAYREEQKNHTLDLPDNKEEGEAEG